MGLIASRPEEPTEWAGLPSEPLEADSLTRLLPDSTAGDLGGLFGIAPVESIAIPLNAIPTPSVERAGANEGAPIGDDADPAVTSVDDGS